MLRGIHIIAAIASLLLLGVPLVARKGASLHRRVGWAWVVAMVVVSVTGIAIALLTLGWPAVMRPGAPAEQARGFALFLLLVGAMTASSIWHGVRAIARKQSPAPSRHPVDVGLPLTAVALALFVFGSGLLRGSVLFSVFGLGAAILTGGHLHFARRPLPSKMAWWYGHMSGMLTAAIAALTAFAVAGLQRYVSVPASLAFLPWVAPGLLLAPVLALWQRYYRVRFERSASPPDGSGEEMA